MKRAIFTRAIFVIAIISSIFTTTYSMQDSTRPSIDPLIAAIFAQNLAEVRRLVNSGHSVCDKSLYRYLPLQVAIMQDREDIFDFLVTCKGMNINAGDIHGNTALHTAAHRADSKYVTKLLYMLRMGLNVNVCNTRRHNPLHALLLQKGLSEDILPIIKSLVAAGIDVDATNDRGRTALHLAPYHKHSQIIEYFLCNQIKRCQIEARDNCGLTPLMIAAKRGNDVAVKILLEHNANVSCVDNENNTSLMLALGNRMASISRFRDFERWRVLKYLLNRLYLQNDMHIVNVINASGKTAYDIAMALGHQAAADLLNLCGAAASASITSINAIRQEMIQQNQIVIEFVNGFLNILRPYINVWLSTVQSAMQQNIAAPAPNPVVNAQFAQPVQAAQQIVHVVNGDRPSMPIIVPTPHITVFPAVSRST